MFHRPVAVRFVFFPCLKILLKQIDDLLCFFKVFLTKVVYLFKSGLERCVSHLACLCDIVLHLVKEDSHVEIDGELDGAAALERNQAGLLVALPRVLDCLAFSLA